LVHSSPTSKEWTLLKTVTTTNLEDEANTHTFKRRLTHTDTHTHTHMHTHTHTFNGTFSGTTQVSQYLFI